MHLETQRGSETRNVLIDFGYSCVVTLTAVVMGTVAAAPRQRLRISENTIRRECRAANGSYSTKVVEGTQILGLRLSGHLRRCAHGLLRGRGLRPDKALVRRICKSDVGGGVRETPHHATKKSPAHKAGLKSKVSMKRACRLTREDWIGKPTLITAHGPGGSVPGALRGSLSKKYRGSSVG